MSVIATGENGSEVLHTTILAEAAANQTRQRAVGPNDDLINIYFNDIDRRPLLKKEDETRLGREVRAGLRAAQQLEEAPELSQTQHRQLEEAVKAGLQAKEKFVEANLRLVVSIAKRYQGSNVPLLDLIQEGSLGLERAVDLFDPEKGFKFSTYATNWIRKSIVSGIINTRRLIRIPDHYERGIATYQKFMRDTGSKIPDLTDEMICESTGFDQEKLDDIRHQIIQEEVDSLDSQVSEGRRDNATIGEKTADPKSSLAMEAAVSTISDVNLLRPLLACLNPREQEIIALCYGLLDGDPKELNEVASLLGVTYQRIQQLRAKALEKLHRQAWKLRLHPEQINE